jgi:AcrR family transcriptional regulator
MPPIANMRDKGRDKGQSAATMPPVPKPEHASPEPAVVLSEERSGPTVGAEPVDGRVARALRLRQERSAQLLTVARRLFAERRYHQTSIQDILDAAGVARGTLYLHFDGKRAMFDALVDSFLTSIRSVVTLVDVSGTAAPPLQQIEDNLLRVMTVLSENRDMTRIVLLMAEGLDGEADSKMDEFYERLRMLLQGALVKGCAMGLLGPIDPEIVSQAALGGLKEVALQWIVRRESDAETLRRVCREILSYSLSGMLART